MTRILSLVVAAVAMGALVTTSASAGTSTTKAAVPVPELHLIASTGAPAAAAAVGLEDPTAQGPVENPCEAAEYPIHPGNECRPGSDSESEKGYPNTGKHNSNGICETLNAEGRNELADGGCKKNEEINPGGAMTIVDGNGVCDTEATGKNFFGFDENDAGGCIAAPIDEGGEYYSTLRTTYLDGVSGGKPLWMQVHLQCGNFTYVGYQPPNGELHGNAPSAMVRVRVKVTNTESGVVRYALPDGRDGDPADLSLTFYEGDGSGAVYCRRTKTLMTKLQAISDYGDNPDLRTMEARHACFIDDPKGTGSVIIDPAACLFAEEVTVIVDQLVANIFSFLLPNDDSTTQRIDVEAWLDTDTFAQPNELNAAATIGLGSMIVQIPHIVPDGEGISLNE